ncbi:hypothetical protein FB480_101818 [Agrobacterium vitis]|nr:hypothetical protein FB480_101818 [Agrobacterium vitis]
MAYPPTQNARGRLSASRSAVTVDGILGIAALVLSMLFITGVIVAL